MTSQIINALEKHQSESSSNTNFHAEYELNSNTVRIEIIAQNSYSIKLPIIQEDIDKLLILASDAKFGKGDKTLLDKKVRDTKEISADKLQVDYNEISFTNMLMTIRDSLGLSENAKLTAHLHNMLIYSPGQFFKPHQDSEKLEGMIATLVIILPTPHIGGDLIIHHNNKKHTFISENLNAQQLKCIAFYSDCQHEVEQIKQGYRIALTYNLVLESDNSELPKYINNDLEIALRDYFSYTDNTSSDPLMLAYFLDHSYTEHSLRWQMLKGGDRSNAVAFRNAAKKLGLISHLALVELHESWSTSGGYYDDEDENAPELEELIENSTELSYWLDSNDQELPHGNYYLSEDEICWTKDTKEFDPVESQYEGYMGNYGNTMDYWYRRAAVVLWREADQQIMNFKLNYTGAINDLLERTQKPGNEKQLVNIIQKAEQILLRSYNEKDYLSSFMQIACYINNAGVAKTLLSKLDITTININNINWLAKLQDIYGPNWCLESIQNWSNKENNYRFHSNKILEKINELVRHMLNSGLDDKLVEFLLKYQINTIIENDKSTARTSLVEIAKYLHKRITIIKDLFNACDALKNTTITQPIINHLISNPILYPELDLSDIILEQLANMDRKNTSYTSLFIKLNEHLMSILKQEYDKGLRSIDDQSIDTTLPCKCNLCKTATSFLTSKTESTKIWPIVTADRDHVADIINRQGLPVDISVEKKGSPYKLVMVKSTKLYDYAKQRYLKVSIYYKKLSMLMEHAK